MRRILFVLLVVVLASCSRVDDVIDSGGTERGKLSVSPTSIMVGNNSGSLTIKVTSNTEWFVFDNGNISGMSVSPTSGRGNGRITVRYGNMPKDVHSESAVVVVYYDSQGIELNKSTDIYRKRNPL